MEDEIVQDTHDGVAQDEHGDEGNTLWRSAQPISKKLRVDEGGKLLNIRAPHDDYHRFRIQPMAPPPNKQPIRPVVFGSQQQDFGTQQDLTSQIADDEGNDDQPPDFVRDIMGLDYN
jgi:hypothetical protein